MAAHARHHPDDCNPACDTCEYGAGRRRGPRAARIPRSPSAAATVMPGLELARAVEGVRAFVRVRDVAEREEIVRLAASLGVDFPKGGGA